MDQFDQDISSRLVEAEADLTRANAEIEDLQHDVAKLMDLLQTVRGGLTFFRVVGVVVRWVASILVAVAVILGFSDKLPINFHLEP